MRSFQGDASNQLSLRSAPLNERFKVLEKMEVSGLMNNYCGQLYRCPVCRQ